MSDSLIDGDYWLNQLPTRPTVLTRANAADGYPNALTPLSQDLVVSYEDAGCRRFFVDEVRGMATEEAPDPYLFSAWGYIFLNADQLAGLGDVLPGSSRQAIYEQYAGLAADPISGDRCAAFASGCVSPRA